MADEKQQVERVDHRQLAENDRSFALTLSEGDAAVDRLLASAQVYASLAIAEQLERLNETLEKSAIEVMYGGATV